MVQRLLGNQVGVSVTKRPPLGRPGLPQVAEGESVLGSWQQLMFGFSQGLFKDLGEGPGPCPGGGGGWG